MAGRIPDNILDDILGRIDIAELISGYIPLKRSGRNFKANCPFHHEKTPSFMVSPDRQIYHCFGCGESGNAFKFLMRHERLEFLEAVEALAKRAGVNIPDAQRASPKDISLTSALYKLNELAANFYSHNLTTLAKAYLLKRGLTEETIALFKIGYAPDTWDALLNHLRQKGVGISLLEKAGLIIAKDQGGYYDRFRNRIILPICDIKSRPIGFGARVMDDTLPKYINSPETPIYTKGKNLYGFNLARDSIRENDYVIIVEGYLDFLVPFQHGVNNIVASLGTALTIDQARLLKRFTNNVVMVYDGDAAGEMAALRSLDIFIEEEMSVKVVSLPKGFDPDSFVRKYGIGAFKEKIELSDSLFEYKLGILLSKHNASSIECKAKISGEMLQTLSKIKNAVLKSEYIKRLAQALDIREDALLYELKNLKTAVPQGVSGQITRNTPLQINPAEKLLIKLMLEETELIKQIKKRLSPEDFQDERISKIVALMFNLMEEGKHIEPHFLINCMQDELTSQVICESIFLPDNLEAQKERIVEDCIKRVKKDRLRVKKDILHNQIKAAQGQGDEESLNRLLEEFHSLLKKAVT